MRILRYVPRTLNFWSSKEKNNREGKREKYLKKENIWSAEEKEKEKGKGGKYLDKEIIWSVEEKKNREGKGGKYLLTKKMVHDREEERGRKFNGETTQPGE